MNHNYYSVCTVDKIILNMAYISYVANMYEFKLSTYGCHYSMKTKPLYKVDPDKYMVCTVAASNIIGAYPLIMYDSLFEFVQNKTASISVSVPEYFEKEYDGYMDGKFPTLDDFKKFLLYMFIKYAKTPI